MALLWETLATRDARLLRASLHDRFRIPPGCAWVNYVRSHDDIGWTFDNGDAARVGISGFHHRQFLNAFYTGRFPGSFARGVPFQENPRTGDARISGTTASLAGLEKALREEGPAEVDLALKRVLLLYGIVLSIGGIPLLYLGDELATRNDYGFRDDAAKAADSRWVHRVAVDPLVLARRTDATILEGRAFTELARLIGIRRTTPSFGGTEAEIVDPGNDHVFGYVRHGGGCHVLALANVTEQEQRVATNQLRLHGVAYGFIDLVTDEPIDGEGDLVLAPYRFVWLVADGTTRTVT